MVNAGPNPAAKLVPIVDPYDNPYMRKIRINDPSCILPVSAVHLANAPDTFVTLWGTPTTWAFAAYPIAAAPVTPVEWPTNMNVFE